VDHKISSIDWSEVGHTILDVVGMIPVVGEIADGINALWYLAEGDYVSAALSAAALVPFAGAAATGAKLIGKGLKKYGDDIAGAAASCIRRNSFVAGTPVLMADGSSKPIEDVQLGDEVLATDPITGETDAREVTDLITGEGDKELLKITVDTDGAAGEKTDVLTATSGHEFWIMEGHKSHWTTAKDLMAGDNLRTDDGTTVEVVGTSLRSEYRKVFNLTVDGIHTYYVVVGAAAVLAHNCEETVLYRSPGTGNRASEARGLNPNNHSGDHPTAYLSNKPEGAAQYAGNGHDLGFHRFVMKPGFMEAFGHLEFPLQMSDGLKGVTEFRIPAERFDEFNSFIDHAKTEWWDSALGSFYPPAK
jgi:hypothetical protein